MKRFDTSSTCLPDERRDSSTGRRLLALGLETGASEPPIPPGTPFGDYELLEELGRGSTGVVYRARHAGIHRTVALKLMRGGDVATDAEVSRFRAGAASAADLDHPNIAPVFHVGRCEGRPFFTMRLLEGGSLAQRMTRCRYSPLAATALVAKVAWAILHAHQRGILHRDLKPANILLDEAGEPYVADFGLARRLDDHAASNQSTSMAGTLDYMAPEQASEDARHLTIAADIYALGAILYELLTCEAPFQGHSTAELLQRLTGPEPVRSPRAIVPGLSRDLESICLGCLEKDPRRRYRSAAELAEDLECARDGRPVSARRRSVAGRGAAWVRRHPAAFTGAAGTALLAAVIALTAWSVWRARETEKRSALQTNAFIASGQAGAVLVQLREYADRIEQASKLKEMAELIAGESWIDNAPAVLANVGLEFDGAFLLDTDGMLKVQWPPPPDPAIFDRSFKFRDYFRGAMPLTTGEEKGVYITRAFHSEGDGQFKFGLTAPVFDRTHAWVGFLVGMKSADSALGKVVMKDSPDGDRITVLLGPRDNERSEGEARALPDGFSLIVHPGLPHGAEYAVRDPDPFALRAAVGAAGAAGKQFRLRYARPLVMTEYRDVLPGFEAQWLAAFAPVGDTGFVLVVQTRVAATMHAARTLTLQLLTDALMPLCIALTLLGACAYFAFWPRRLRHFTGGGGGGGNGRAAPIGGLPRH
jgi:hypothetical protein